MATLAQVKRQRLTALRQLKAVQRRTDSSIERLERRLKRMLKRKTIIDREDALALVTDYWEPFFDQVRDLEQAVHWFVLAVSE